jgi:biopolymer transport protein ExbD
MAFQMNSGGLGGRRRRGGSGALAEINIIPLVDVVLVLLVIFMLTAHVMEFGLEVEVPKVKQQRNTTEELPVVTITRTGELFLNEAPVNINNLAAEYQRRFAGQKAVYVRCDKQTIFDPLAQVISALGEAKLDVKLVTQPDDAGAK